MSEKMKPIPMSDNLPIAETQKERWVKYGGNVTLTIVVMVAVSILLIYLGQKKTKRWDTTTGHKHSLSEPTVELIRNLPGKVKLVSLYTKSKHDDTAKADSDNSALVRYREVADLIEEYQRKGNNVTAEVIDPYTEPGKVQQLFDEVSKRYGNNVKLYQERLDEFVKNVNEISHRTDVERDAMNAVLKSSNNPTLKQVMEVLRNSVDQLPEALRDLQATLPAEQQKQNPDYKRAADAAKSQLRELSLNIQGLIDQFDDAPKQLAPAIASLQEVAATQPSTTQPSEERDTLETLNAFLAYAKESTPRYTAMKKLVDDQVDHLANLGELKQLDELRAKKTDSIVVMGTDDMIVIPSDRVWLEPLKGMQVDPDSKEKVRFAGEQQISTALAVLNSPNRPIVAFIRNGGPPLTVRGDHPPVPPYYTGPYYAIAAKLREYNFEIVEKDASGEWMQYVTRQMQQGPVDIEPEATPEQLKRAVWVVRPGPPQSEEQMMQGAPPSRMAPMLTEHLNEGGSAMVLFGIRDDQMATALDPWGVKALTDSVALHDVPPENEGRSSDRVDELLRMQYYWVINQYGEHPVTTGLDSLDAILVPPVPVTVSKADGVTSSSILPLVQGNLKVWGKLISTITADTKPPFTFDPKLDMNPPLFAGAALEKVRTASAGSGVASKNPGGNRLVVVGADFPDNRWLTVREKDFQRGGTSAPRFPGNSELMTNSIFWLSKMEKMMNIAPASRDVVLISQVGPAWLAFWRVMILLFVPAIVLAVGGRIYFMRRD